ncbi:hypothetical protein [Desulfovirgula thermocuniculi]|uniref:hypothetical protein n=1 Tax=Desulfovirgula thermocuniculi TaxID=348842 RepID=UPI0004895F49|nr:hypothetical protein [Desulfovirgula thermocuniculi]
MPRKRDDAVFPWLEENYYRYERVAEFRRRAPDAKTRRRGVDGRFLADDEFEMDLPTVYIDGEEWDPADLELAELELEEVGWPSYVLEEGPIFQHKTKCSKKIARKSRKKATEQGLTDRVVPEETVKVANNTPACVACGIFCVPLTQIQRGKYIFYLCKSCLTEATRYFGFSEADDLDMCVGKLLALRRPGKAEKAKQRFQSLGIDLSWEMVERIAKYFREVRRNMVGAESVRGEQRMER